MPFTGVATELATYRLETKKIKKQAEVIGKQAEEIAGLKKEVAVADSAKSQLSTALLDQKQLTNSAQQTVVTLRVNEAAMVKAYEAAKPKWFERPKLVGPVSFTAGSLLTGFLLLKVL